MTSKRCTKTFNRKLSNSSIQFDKLIQDSSNRPSAAKSAGTVGKWGTTSFTSIRSTNINESQRTEIKKTCGVKRAREEVKYEKSVPPVKKDEESQSDVNKPKKFFKSRNLGADSKDSKDGKGSQNISHSHSSELKRGETSKYSSNVLNEVGNQNDSDGHSRDEEKPPIVLRICKGKAKLICSDDPAPESHHIPLLSPTSKTENKKKTYSKSVKSEGRAKSDVDKTYRASSRKASLLASQNPEPTEMRTTRSRAKTVSTDVSSDPVPAPIDTYPEVFDQPHDKSTSDSDYTHNSDTLTTEKSFIHDEPEPEPEIPSEVEEKIQPPYLPPTHTDNLESFQSELYPQESVENKKELNYGIDSRLVESVSVDPMKSENIEISSIENTVVDKKIPPISKPASSKKGSIFKTRSTGAKDSNKRRAVYKHKWCDSEKAANTDATKAENPGTHMDTMAFDEETENTALTRIVSYPESDMNFNEDSEGAVSSIRCGKKIKEFYTKVKNVKKAHQIQESGEFQEFNDDVEYILDTLRENNPNATRCLSAIRLATKCMIPAFRMHVRAHGTVAKFFKALHDATNDQSLALCTATVMFVLSQDRLAMDLDRDCLELMLNLLESDVSHKNALEDCGLSYAELSKNKEKVCQLCAEIQSQGHAKHLNLDNITVGQLAMETLLSLTSKRAGEWFKEELRELGGLEHIIRTITDCHRHIFSSGTHEIHWNELLLDKLRKVDRCLRVLENVTHMNEENQIYLLKYNDSILVITLASLYNLCRREIMKYPVYDCTDKTSNGAVIRECLSVVIKVFINLTHRFNGKNFEENRVKCQDGIINDSLYLILRVPEVVPEEKRFDIMMLALILLINLIEQSENNKKLLLHSKIYLNDEDEQNCLDALIHLFYKQEELARAEEQKTDAILDGKKDEKKETSSTSKSQEESIEETVAKLLQKAGRHMEHTFIAAYVVLLLGYLMMDNEDYENLVKSKLPDGKFATMVTILQKFFDFMNLTASNEMLSCGIAATEKVIRLLKMSDIRSAEECSVAE